MVPRCLSFSFVGDLQQNKHFNLGYTLFQFTKTRLPDSTKMMIFSTSDILLVSFVNQSISGIQGPILQGTVATCTPQVFGIHN